jgi:predicted  nucleic acid-binding Zn-ribbon protein
MREILEILVKLQNEIVEERKLMRIIESAPEKIALLNEQLNSHENSLKVTEERFKSTVAERAQQELELKTKESKKAKFQDQLMTVKDNVQYKAALNEIAFLEKEIGSAEEKILVLMEDEDKLSDEKKTSQKALMENKTKIEKEKEILNQQKAVIESELVKIRSNKEELRKHIDEEILGRFDTLANKKDGIGIAGVADDGICRSCRFKIRPQVYAELRADTDIQHCDNCDRLLYYIPPEIEEEK